MVLALAPQLRIGHWASTQRYEYGIGVIEDLQERVYPAISTQVEEIYLPRFAIDSRGVDNQVFRSRGWIHDSGNYDLIELGQSTGSFQ